MTVDEMAALHARCFPDKPWSAQEIEDMLHSGSVLSFISPDEDGLLLTRVLSPEAEILTLAVDPGARRRGVGFDLVSKWIEIMSRLDVTDLYLEVAADNVPALGLYERHRFLPSGRRRGYYARPGCAPVDAVLMHRAVTQGQDH